MSRSQKRRARDRASYFARPYLPAVVLAIDPGEQAGAAILLPAATPNPPRLWYVGTVEDVMRGREPETIVRSALALADRLNLKLVMVLEEWGRGGPLGIDQWIGLGERRGVWKRALYLEGGDSEVLATRPVVQVAASTWRAQMIERTGNRVGEKFVAFGKDDWKRAATNEFGRTWPTEKIDSADAAEAALLGAYALRSDKVFERLGKRYMASKGFDTEAYETDDEKPARAARAHTVRAGEAGHPRRMRRRVVHRLGHAV